MRIHNASASLALVLVYVLLKKNVLKCHFFLVNEANEARQTDSLRQICLIACLLALALVFSVSL